MTATSGGPSVVPLNIQADSGQIVDLQQWSDSTGAELSCITNVGWFNISGALAPFPVAPIFISLAGGNSYLQTNVQNLSAGVSASSDMVVTADIGNNTTNYVDLGINSSTYADPGYTGQAALDSYLQAYGGNLDIGTGTATSTIKFNTGGTLTGNLRVTISDTNFTLNSIPIAGPTYISFVSEYQVNSGIAVTSDFTVNFFSCQNQMVLLGGSVSIASLIFPGVGNYVLRIIQDATGNRVLTWPSAVQAPGGKTTGLVLSTAGDAIDIASIYYNETTAYVVLSKAFAT
jgi:hypothetical protein